MTDRGWGMTDFDDSSIGPAVIDDVEEAFAAPAETAEVAYDVGVQLGRGHTRKLEAELDKQLRREQLRLLDRDGDAIRAGGRELAGLTVDAWQRFKAAAELTTGSQ